MKPATGKYSSIALSALKCWAQENGIKQSEIARICGVSRSVLTFWWRGDARPGSWRRFVLSAAADIDVEDWLTDEEQDLMAKASTRCRLSLGNFLEGTELNEARDRISRLSN